MNLSGILVMLSPDNFTVGLDELTALTGVEVYQSDPETGRVVVVQEAENIGAEVQGIKRIKELPHVRLAEMVYHYIADDNDVLDTSSEEFARMSEDLKVPAYLNN